MNDAALVRLADLVAERVLTRLETLQPSTVFLTPHQVAELLQVDRGYVYEHARELGARRLGSGPKARLRFRLEDVKRATPCLADRESDHAVKRMTEPKRRRQRTPRLGTEVALLPIRGSSEVRR